MVNIMGLFSKKGKQELPTNPVLQEMQSKKQAEQIKNQSREQGGLPQQDDNILHQVMLQPRDLFNLPVWAWVWIECYSQFDNPLQQSAYYRKVPTSSGNSMDTLFCGYPGCIFGFNYASYGIDWVAYKYQP